MSAVAVSTLHDDGAASVQSAPTGPWDDLEQPARVNVKQMSNGDLVRVASKGDEHAWEELVHRLGGMVHRVAKRTGLNDSDAADVVQLTWLRLMRSGDRIRDPERIAAWLVTTARRESTRIAIVGNRVVLSDDPLEIAKVDVGSFDAVVESTVLRAEYEPSLDRALRGLSPPYQRLVGLLFSDLRLTYAEIAEAMGVPVGSIGPMRLRCLAMLRRDPHVTARPRP